jgi:FkbM family methyltransferase
MAPQDSQSRRRGYAAPAMEERSPAPLETEVPLVLPDGSTVLLAGEAADRSVVGSIGDHDGSYEPGLMSVLASLTTPDSVCLDVGANVGPVTLALSRLCPRGAVHAFEPTAESFAFLERNVAANGASNVSAYRLALSDHAGTATIQYDPAAAGAAFISEHLSAGVPQDVPLDTLDAWAAAAGLERLDFVKIDVEGCELQVLDGGRATLARFRPALVVEVNPVTLRRMQHRQPRDLYRRLLALYGRGGHLAVVPEKGPMLPLLSFAQLRRHLAEYGVCNVVCSAARLRPGRRGMAGAGATARALARSAARYRRGATPPWAAVIDPHVLIRVDGPGAGGLTDLRGAPGERHVLTLLLANHGAVAVVGGAERLPVSLRVVWIDPEGHHRVDDRSRMPAPAMRPGATATARLAVWLPDRPGRYRLRITLFQEHFAWFVDLDPSSCCELDVEVTPPV